MRKYREAFLKNPGSETLPKNATIEDYDKGINAIHFLLESRDIDSFLFCWVQNNSRLVKLGGGINFGAILARIRDGVIKFNSDSSEIIYSLDSLRISATDILTKLLEIKNSNVNKEGFANSILLSKKVSNIVTTIGSNCELPYSKRIYILFELNVLLDQLDAELSANDFGVEVELLLREIREKTKASISDILRYGKN